MLDFFKTNFGKFALVKVAITVFLGIVSQYMEIEHSLERKKCLQEVGDVMRVRELPHPEAFAFNFCAGGKASLDKWFPETNK